MASPPSEGCTGDAPGPLLMSNCNWWKLPSARTQRCEIKSLEQFLEQAEKYTREHITQVFASRHESKGQTRLKAEDYELVELKTVLDESKYKRLCETAGTLTNRYTPMMTFHGTTAPEIVNSIVKYGYLMPYDVHPAETVA